VRPYGCLIQLLSDAYTRRGSLERQSIGGQLLSDAYTRRGSLERQSIGGAPRGPRSTWGQSRGIPVSGFTAPPPPHLRPFITVTRPQIAFITGVGRGPSQTSAPVAGHVRWVESSLAAAGRPFRRRAFCSLTDRNPEMIQADLPVSFSKS